MHTGVHSELRDLELMTVGRNTSLQCRVVSAGERMLICETSTALHDKANLV